MQLARSISTGCSTSLTVSIRSSRAPAVFRTAPTGCSSTPARRGGSIAVSRLTSEWFYSKQTINSAIKTLTARGFATLEFAEGSRKNKVVSLTEEGRRFAERYALPALKAEQRAFGALEPCEQREIMRLIGKFSQVLGDECDAFKQHIAAESQAENQGEGESCDC